MKSFKRLLSLSFYVANLAITNLINCDSYSLMPWKDPLMKYEQSRQINQDTFATFEVN